MNPVPPRVLCSLLVLGLIGCARDSVDQVTSGIAFEVEDSVFVGGLADSTSIFFSDPVDAAISPGGQVVLVVDRQRPGVVALSAEGTSLFALTSRGQGPSEWQQPRAATWTGSAFAVWDARRDRVVSIDERGTVLGARPLVRSQTGPNLFMGGKPLIDGWVIETAAPWSDLAAETILPSLLALRDPADSVRVVREFPNPAPLVAARPTRDGAFSYGSQFIESQPLMGASSDGSFVFVVTRPPASPGAMESSFEVLLFRPDGSPRGAFEVRYAPQRAGDVARDSLRRTLELWFDQAGAAADMFDLETSLAAYWIPEQLPPVTSVVADPHGLWIAREALAVERRWERYSLAGELSGWVNLDRGVRVLSSADSLLVVRSDGMAGEPRIGLLRLRTSQPETAS